MKVNKYLIDLLRVIVIYLFFNFSLGILFEYTLNYNELINNYLYEKLTKQQMNSYFLYKKKWQLFSYVFIIIVFLMKTLLVSSVLYIGTFFFSKIKVIFKHLFYIVVKAEFVFLGVGVLKIVWFYFFQTNYTLEDLQYFYPLSALNIVGYKGLDSWFIYPLQTLNLFELAYWFLLAYYVGKIASPTKSKEENKYPIDFGLKIVASSYGSALLLWIVVVMFFTLNYS